MVTARVRLVDVAAAAGVTKGTASRILNRDPHLVVQPETRQRVWETATRLGYRPHASAKALATARTMTLALIAPPLDNPPYVTISRGASLRAEELGYLSLLGEDFDARPASRSIIDGGRVDGIIMGSARPGHPLVAQLAESGLPHVFLNRGVAGSGRNVTMDVGAASHLAVAHLVELGHRRIAHLAGPAEIHPSAARATAYQEAMHAHGLTPLPIVHADFTEAAATVATPEILASGVPTAIFTSALAQAIGVLHALQARGMRVPRDMSVLSSDDFPIAAFTVPPLTAIVMPLLELGAAAVDAVIAQLEGEEPKDTMITIPPRLIPRASTGLAPHVDE